MPRDSFYRSKCSNPREYDRVIDFIRDFNPHIQDRTTPAKEEFAIEAVHSCIRSVLFSNDKPGYASTGMALAVRENSDKSKSGYHLVMLAIHLPLETIKR